MEKSNKVKLMISYGGKIHHRPHDHRLSYHGGDTRILSVDRHVTFSDLLSKLTSLSHTSFFSLKYQLPGQDLDALISLTNGEDLENMLSEYDLLQGIISPRPNRLRLFLFPGSNRFDPDFLFGFDKEVKYEAPREGHVTGGCYGVGPVYLVPVVYVRNEA